MVLLRTPPKTSHSVVATVALTLLIASGCADSGADAAHPGSEAPLPPLAASTGKALDPNARAACLRADDAWNLDRQHAAGTPPTPSADAAAVSLADGVIQAAQSRAPDFARLAAGMLAAQPRAPLLARDLSPWMRQHFAADARRLRALCRSDGWRTL